MMVLRTDVEYSHFSDASNMPLRIQPKPVARKLGSGAYGWLLAPSDHNYVVCEAVAILTPPSISIKLRRDGLQDVDINILNVERKSFGEEHVAGVCSGYTRSRYRPPRTHTALFVHLKIDPDHLTHFFETGASWYLILRPQRSVNGVAGGYIRAENGGLAHSLALVFTRLNAAQKGEWAARPQGPRALTRTLHWEEIHPDEEIPVDYNFRVGGGGVE